MATITGSATGGAYNTSGAWVGGVIPGSGDDVLLTATSGNINIPSATTVAARSIDFTGYTGTFTFSATTSELDIGDASGGKATFVSTMTLALTGVGKLKFVSTTASTTYSLTTGGRVMPNIEVATASTTKIQLADALTATGATLTLTSGSWDWNGQSVTAGSFSSSNSNTRTLTLGASSITITGVGTPWSIATSTNMTFNANTSTITINGAAAGMSPGALTYNNVVMSGSGLQPIGGQVATFANFTRTGTAVKTDGVSFGANVTVTGTLTVSGNSTTNRVLIQSSVVGTSRTITAATVTTSNIDVQDITGAGAGSWDLSAIAGNSGDCGGNSGITFTTSAQQTATGTASFTWSTHGWTTRVPLPQDDVVINNAFVAGRTITADMPRLGRSMDFTGCTGSPIFSPSLGVAFFGSLTFVSGITTSGSSALAPSGRSSYTITSAGVSFASNPVNVTAPTGTYTLADAYLSTAQLGLVQGSLVDGGKSVSCATFSSSSTNTGRTLSRTGGWTLTNTAAVTFWNVNASGLTVTTNTGSITVGATSTNTRTFAGGGLTYGTLTYTVAGSTGGLTITGANTFATVNFSDASNARTLTLPASTTTTVTTFAVNGTAGLLMSVVSSTGGTAATLALANPSTMNYLSVQDITATPSNAVYVLDGTNVSGNTGIVFEPNSAQHPSLRLTLIPAIAARGGGNAAAQRASSW